MAVLETSATAPGEEPDPALRADAERNRERILLAARRLYATEGLGVSMASVAREAGVGKATLSRRFATRDDLITAVFADRMEGYAAATAEALSDPDPWRGFTTYIEAVCAMQAADRGFADVLTLTFPAAKALEARRAEAYHGFVEIVQRAKATGKLRADFVPEDLVILFMANAGVIAATGDAAADSWRRLVGHMLRAFATPGAPMPAMPEGSAPAALYRAMVRLANPHRTSFDRSTPGSGSEEVGFPGSSQTGAGVR